MRKDQQDSHSTLQTADVSASSAEHDENHTGICLFELVEDIIHRHQPQSSEKQTHLVCNIHPSLPSRMLLNSARVLALLDDLTHFFIRHCQQGKVSLLFNCATSHSLPQAQQMSVQLSIRDARQQPEQDYIRLFDQQMSDTHDAIRQLGGSISDGLSGQDSGISFTLPYQTVKKSFEQHNHPESCILILEQEPAMQAALQRILGEISPNVRLLSDPEQLLALLAEPHKVSLLVLGLPENEQHNTPVHDSLIQQLMTINERRQIPVLTLLEPGHSPPLPVDWQRLGKPIRKKGLLRVADRLLRQQKETQAAQTRQVLVAEDNEINQKVISKLLDHHQIEYSIASNGEMAVRLFAEQPSDLILMDIHMPGIDGIEATRLIRQLNDRGARVPIIAMTADTLHETRVKCQSVGINDALIKPLELEDIQTCVMSWLYDEEEQPAVDRAIPDCPLSDMREELHSMLLGMLPDYQKQLLGYVEQQDLTGLADTAHAIAGAASYCGTNDLKQAAMALEVQLHSATPEDYAPALESLLQTVRQLRK